MSMSSPSSLIISFNDEPRGLLVILQLRILLIDCYICRDRDRPECRLSSPASTTMPSSKEGRQTFIIGVGCTAFVKVRGHSVLHHRKLNAVPWKSLVDSERLRMLVRSHWFWFRTKLLLDGVGGRD